MDDDEIRKRRELVEKYVIDKRLSLTTQAWFREAGATLTRDDTWSDRFHIELKELVFAFEDFSYDDDDASMEILGTVLAEEGVSEEEAALLTERLEAILPEGVTLDVEEIHDDRTRTCIWVVRTIEGDDAADGTVQRILAEFVELTDRAADLADEWIFSRRPTIPPAASILPPGDA